MADKSERVEVVKTDEGYKTKRKVFEELKDNEGNRKDWKARIASKKLKTDKEK